MITSQTPAALTPAQSVALDHYRHGTPLDRMIAPSTRAALARMGLIRIAREQLPHGGRAVYYVVALPDANVTT